MDCDAKVPLVPWVLREKCGLVRAEIGCCDWLIELCSLVGADFRSLYTVPCVSSRVVCCGRTVQRLDLHEGTDLLKQGAAWGCSAGCRSCFRTCCLGYEALQCTVNLSGPGRRGCSGVDGG